MGKLLSSLIAGLLLFTALTSCAGNALPKGSSPAQLTVVKPPFQSNKKFMVSQGFHGRRSHTNEFNAYAIDFAMLTGEPVCAAMSGIVESYNDVNRPMAENKRFREDNYVRILHTDKTWGLYTHLQPGSITVKAGQKIPQGTCFARVGNTGYSTGPHLHFALLRLLPDRFISIPFRIMQPNGKTIIPAYLQWVKN